ncbi:MAG: hydrolase [Gammaproteobacteria bacterium]|nr:hydrolase [Gammaproteobacteria bacterium]
MTYQPFTPATGLFNPHLQTMWASLIRRRPALKTHRERVELADGDFLDLDWAITDNNKKTIVLMIHGLTGSIQSPYACGLLHHLSQMNYQPVVMHLRACSGEINRLARLYHSGETGDLDYVVQHIRRAHPHRPIAVIGFSLGGNMLLKWLGESVTDRAIDAAVAVSVPFDLYHSARQLDRGFARLYQWNLLRSLRRTLRAKSHHPEIRHLLPDLNRMRNFYQFDDGVTAPLHGFTGAMDYYQQNSSRQFLKSIRIPTLILHAKDDPFLLQEDIPETNELSDTVQLELSPHGGHVGFVGGTIFSPQYWLEPRIAAFLQEKLPT